LQPEGVWKVCSVRAACRAALRLLMIAVQSWVVVWVVMFGGSFREFRCG
jgi:hypothetical protein